MTIWTHGTMIVPESFVELARVVCETLDRLGLKLINN